MAEEKARVTSILADYFRKTGGPPPRTAWLWGATPSILAWTIAHLFFLLRCVSPLQHLKQFARWRAQKEATRKTRKGAVEINQQRPNFEARHTELYFLIYLAVVAAIFFVPTWPMPALLHEAGFVPLSPSAARWILVVAKWLAVISLVETLVWISYYLVWRNFAEPGYSLYHPAEYFALLPVILVLQCIDIAILSGEGIGTVILTMGNARDGSGAVSLLGQYYIVVIIANLLSMFPATRFKAPTAINIIGAGDVVANRMAPALLDGVGRLTPAHIQVFTVNGPDDLSRAIETSGIEVIYPNSGLPLDRAEASLIDRIVASGAPTIVASPSESHFRYILELNATGRRFAVEKPISVLRQEIDVFLKTPDIFKDRMFALSYYGLEKALPLTYFLSANYHYQDFLEISGPALQDQASPLLHIEAPRLLRRLGALKDLRVDLIEGLERSPTAGRRAWTERDGPEGLAFETMIHPLIIAHKLLACAGSSIDHFAPIIKAGQSSDSVTESAVTYLGFTGTVNSGSEQRIAVQLHCAKYADKRTTRRNGMATFEHGSVSFDFDKKTCAVSLSSKHGAVIAVKEKYRNNYAIQMELVARFFTSGWTDIRYDDFVDQMAVLAWLLKTDLNVPQTVKYGRDVGFSALKAELG